MRPPGKYSCGEKMAVNPSAFSGLTHEQMFFLNATSWLCLLEYELASLIREISLLINDLICWFVGMVID